MEPTWTFRIREWFGSPLWELQPRDADDYFGRILHKAAPATRHGKAGTLSLFFDFLELPTLPQDPDSSG